MELHQLEKQLQCVEPAVRLVSERHLLQVLYYLSDWGYPLPVHAGLPHWVARSDLEAMGTLPPEVLRGSERQLLLLTTPDDRLLDHLQDAELLRAYWRLLFQAAIQRRVDEWVRDGALSSEQCQQRLERWGGAALREILHVLNEEHLLPEQAGPTIVYRTLAAIYLDLAAFEPERVADFFPSLPPAEELCRQWEVELDWRCLLERTRPAGAAEACPAAEVEPQWWELDSPPGATAAQSEQVQRVGNAEAATQWARQAEIAERRCQWVRAAILQMRRAEASPDEAEQAAAHAAAEAALQRVVVGLAAMWGWDESLQREWLQALRPLLPLAAHGHWPRAARCLYELQKLQGFLQRELYTVDLPEFLRTLGRRPIVRPLPHARLVRQLISWRKARRQMLRAGLSSAARLRLDRLFHYQQQQLEQNVRQQLAPLIRQSLDEAGLVPAALVEEVSRDKLIAELLDQICTSGYVRFGDLRDAVARNHLKLPDLQGPGEWLWGDALLRADQILAEQLDGVYHRGEIYLRSLHRFSALLFGTRAGRWLSLYVLAPFGGAFLILMFLEEVRHLGHKAVRLFMPPAVATATAEPAAAPSPSEAPTTTSDPETGLSVAPPPRPVDPPSFTEEEEWDEPPPLPPVAPPATEPPALLWYGSEHGSSLVTGVLTSSAAVAAPEKPSPSWLVAPPTIFGVGVFFLLLLHVPPFRRGVLALLRQAGVLLRVVCWEWPRALWRAPLVRLLRQSRPVRFLFYHFWTPTLLALCTLLALFLLGINPLFLFDWLWLAIWAGLTLAYNTPWGWLIQDRIAETLADWWRQVRVNLIPGLIAVFIDWFHRLVNWVERGLYAVDEWLRYRGGDSRLRLAVKACLGLLWFPIAYAFRFIFYLLVEPQVNPIKHFPVVTVSHKVIWPLVPQIAEWTGISVWTVSMIINGIPGIFGFIAWEFKENWRLYAANRARRLRPVPVGSHGETLRRLLRPGFHSGTLPRCYRKLRRPLTATQHAHWHQELHHIVEAVQRFAERDLLALLHAACPSLAIHVHQVRTGCRRLLLELQPANGGPPLQLAFEERDGCIDADILAGGWTRQLDGDLRHLLVLALRGFLDAAAADLYAGRPRLELELPLAKDFDDLRRCVSWEEWRRSWEQTRKPVQASLDVHIDAARTRYQAAALQ